MPNSRLELLTVAEMGRADRATIDGGIPGIELMEEAGRRVAFHALRYPGPVLVLCGPGNNGGDGVVAARRLAAQGRRVTLALLGAREALKGDAAAAAGRWTGPVTALSSKVVGDFLSAGEGVVIDALFGAGLSRPLEGDAAKIVEAINRSGVPVIAVDVPSGIMGDTGEAQGPAVHAAETVTFCRLKPGHLLYPGRGQCGPVTVADIGITDGIVDGIEPSIWQNGCGLWQDAIPVPQPTDHKYSRGHLVIWGSAEMPGAARLAAAAARRAGAGMVTIACPPEARQTYLAGAPGLLVHPCAGTAEFKALIARDNVHALLIGPGSPADGETRARADAALAEGKPLVMDAGALTAFADEPGGFLGAVHENTVMTPHEGEFARLFDASGDKLSRARRGAETAGGTVLLKGPDTVIAGPDGRAVINGNGAADLATAGTGDVLAGIIVGLMSQGMTPFQASAAGAWLHAEAGRRLGRALIAEDIPDCLPFLLDELAPRD